MLYVSRIVLILKAYRLHRIKATLRSPRPVGCRAAWIQNRNHLTKPPQFETETSVWQVLAIRGVVLAEADCRSGATGKYFRQSVHPEIAGGACRRQKLGGAGD